jgi:alpha-aminoadipic semialdehyde synthase
MPALDSILAKNIRLIDYEKISDHKNNRLIAFGKYAGVAGAIDFMKGLG